MDAEQEKEWELNKEEQEKRMEREGRRRGQVGRMDAKQEKEWEQEKRMRL